MAGNRDQSRSPNYESKPVELPSGNYRIQVMLGGVRHSVTGASKQEAREKRDDLKRRFREQRLTRTKRARRPTREYLEWWLETKRGTVEPSTWARYRYEITQRLVPTVGDIRLGDLTADDLREALQLMLKGAPPLRRSVAPRTGGLRPRDPLPRAQAGGRRTGSWPGTSPRTWRRRRCRRRRRGPSPLRRWSGCSRPAKAIGTRSGSWRSTPGMRQGELLGLPWDALVEDVGDGTREGEVTVRQVLAEGEDADLYLRGYTKSEAGFRTIRIPDFVVAELGRHRERQAAERRTASRWEHDGLVFVSRFGTFLLRSNVIRAFKRACADARPAIAGPVNPHLCRHTFASHLFAERRPVTEISYVLGHSSRSVTLDIYGHFLSTEGQGTPSALARSYRGAGRRAPAEPGRGCASARRPAAGAGRRERPAGAVSGGRGPVAGPSAGGLHTELHTPGPGTPRGPRKGAPRDLVLGGVTDGYRTRNLWSHNPVLCH